MQQSLLIANLAKQMLSQDTACFCGLDTLGRELFLQLAQIVFATQLFHGKDTTDKQEKGPTYRQNSLKGSMFRKNQKAKVLVTANTHVHTRAHTHTHRYTHARTPTHTHTHTRTRARTQQQLVSNHSTGTPACWLALLVFGHFPLCFRATRGSIFSIEVCHAMPCYAMLCHAMPCYAMLCHAMPRRFVAKGNLCVAKEAARCKPMKPSQGGRAESPNREVTWVGVEVRRIQKL